MTVPPTEENSHSSQRLPRPEFKALSEIEVSITSSNENHPHDANSTSNATSNTNAKAASNNPHDQTKTDAKTILNYSKIRNDANPNEQSTMHLSALKIFGILFVMSFISIYFLKGKFSLLTSHFSDPVFPKYPIIDVIGLALLIPLFAIGLFICYLEVHSSMQQNSRRGKRISRHGDSKELDAVINSPNSNDRELLAKRAHIAHIVGHNLDNSAIQADSSSAGMGAAVQAAVAATTGATKT